VKIIIFLSQAYISATESEDDEIVASGSSSVSTTKEPMMYLPGKILYVTENPE
jgi:hypothetical protein